VPGDFREELMKGVIERSEGRNRGITEAERADKRRAKRWGASGRRKSARDCSGVVKLALLIGASMTITCCCPELLYPPVNWTAYK